MSARTYSYSAAILTALLMSGLAICLSLGPATSLAQEDEAFRKFKDKSGKYEIEARFIEFKDSKVVLERRDGRMLKVGMTALSSADQAYVRQQLRARRTKAEPKPATTATTATTGGSSAAESQDADATAGWRGENRQGVVDESGLLDAWPDAGPPLAWRSQGLGGGYSSVAIQGDRLFTMGRNDDGDSELIACKLPGGEVLWRAVVREGDEPPNCTPVVDGDRVYALGFKGNLVCCEVATGKIVWSRSFTQDFGGKMMSQWGYSESPLIDGEKLICTPGAPRAMLAALNKKTGEPIWTTPMPPNAGRAGQDGAGYSSPVISRGGGVKQYVQLVGRGLIGVDAEKGQLLWGYNRIANGTANVPTPLVSGDYVFGSTGYRDGGSALLKLERSGRGVTAREVYYIEGNRTQNHHGGMVMLGDYIYMGEGHNNGFPLCLNWRTGQDAWRPGRGPGSGSAAIICADGQLYFRYQDGKMALIEATPDEYRLKGEFRLATRHGNSWPHPVVHNGFLYIRDQHELLCYNVAK